MLTGQLTQPYNPTDKNHSYKTSLLVWNIHIHQDLIYIHLGHILWVGQVKNLFSTPKHNKVSNKQQHTMYPWVFNSYMFFFAQATFNKESCYSIFNWYNYNLLQVMGVKIMTCVQELLIMKSNNMENSAKWHWSVVQTLRLCNFPELVGFRAWYIFVTVHVCFGWLVSVMVKHSVVCYFGLGCSCMSLPYSQ